MRKTAIIIVLILAFSVALSSAETVTSELIDKYVRTPEERGIMVDTIGGWTTNHPILYITVGKLSGKLTSKDGKAIKFISPQ